MLPNAVNRGCRRCVALIVTAFLLFTIPGCGGGSVGTGSSNPDTIRVKGTLVSGQTQQPLAGFEVLALGTRTTDTTNEFGEFNLNTRFGGGELELVFRSSSVNSSFTVSNVKPSTTPIILELELDEETNTIRSKRTSLDDSPRSPNKNGKHPKGKEPRSSDPDDTLTPPDQSGPSKPVPTPTLVGPKRPSPDPTGPRGKNPNAPSDPKDGAPDEPESDTPDNDAPAPNPDDPSETPPGERPTPGTPDAAFLSLPTERIYNAARSADLISIRDGSWFNPETWSTGVVPTEGSIVQIGSGTHVIYDRESSTRIHAIGINDGGTLAFSRRADTRLLVGTLIVREGGRLEIGSAANPLSKNFRAELIIADSDQEIALDAEEYSGGIIALGDISIHGSALQRTWVRTSQEPHAGDTELVLEDAIEDWPSGATVVLPDTRQVPTDQKKRWFNAEDFREELRIASTQGNRIHLATPLAHDHLGGKRITGELVFLPHVLLLDRNVVIRSENPEGRRGHVLLSDTANVDIRYARFTDLGRTDAFATLDNTIFEVDVSINDTGDVYSFQISGGEVTSSGEPSLPRGWSAVLRFGKVTIFDTKNNLIPSLEMGDWRVLKEGSNQIDRYPLHLRHVIGSRPDSSDSPQFILVGNTVDRAKKWGYVLHGSSFGLVRDNIAYGVDGAGFVTSEGSEVGNRFERNFALGITGTGSESFRLNSDFGSGGSGFIARRTGNHYVGNAVANARYSGWTISSYYNQSVRVPSKPGGDIFRDPSDSELLITNPSGSFLNNEIYGRTQYGVWTAWTAGFTQSKVAQPIVFADSAFWHLHETAFSALRTENVKLYGLEILCDTEASASSKSTRFTWNGVPTGISFHGFENSETEIRDSWIEGCIIGAAIGSTNKAMQGGAPTVVSDTQLKNYVNILFTNGQGTFGNGLIVDSVYFQKLRPQDDLGYPQFHIQTRLRSSYPYFLIQPSRIEVLNYNGQSADNFEIFFNEQASNFEIESADSGSTEFLTNAESFNRFGLSAGGAPAPCSQRREGIEGIVCEHRGKQPTINHLSQSAGATSGSLRFTVTTDEPTRSFVRYRIRAGGEWQSTEWAPTSTRHEIRLETLRPKTFYDIWIKVINAQGLSTETTIEAVKTPS